MSILQKRKRKLRNVNSYVQGPITNGRQSQTLNPRGPLQRPGHITTTLFYLPRLLQNAIIRGHSSVQCLKSRFTRHLTGSVNCVLYEIPDTSIRLSPGACAPGLFTQLLVMVLSIKNVSLPSSGYAKCTIVLHQKMSLL